MPTPQASESQGQGAALLGAPRVQQHGSYRWGTHLENPTQNAVGRGRAVFISYAHADNSGPDPAAFRRQPERLPQEVEAAAGPGVVAAAEGAARSVSGV